MWVSTVYFPPIGLCTANDHCTHTLHPTQGHACALPHQEGQVPDLYCSCNFDHSKTLSLYHFTYPSHSDLFSILTSEPNKITNQQLPWSISPQMPSLSMPWPCTTLQQTSHDVISLISNVMCSTTWNGDWWSPAKYEDNAFSRDHLSALFNCQTAAFLTEPKHFWPTGLDPNAPFIHLECQLIEQILGQPWSLT